MAKQKLRPVVLDDLYRMRSLSNCSLSVDGELLASTISHVDRVSNKIQSHIWIIPSQQGAMQQYTFGNHHDFSPCFSPNGKLLAFLSDRSGSSQVHLMRVTGGESWQLSHIQGSVFDFAWSPDGNQLCLSVSPTPTSNNKSVTPQLVHHFTGYSVQPQTPGAQLHLLDIRTGRSRIIVNDENINYSPSFSSDGKWLVFCSQKHPGTEIKHQWPFMQKLSLLDRNSPKRVKTHNGPVYSPKFSPDGKWIAFKGFAESDKGWNQSNVDLCIIPTKGGNVQYLSGLLDRVAVNMVLSDHYPTWQIKPPVWSPDSKSLYTVITDGGTTSIYRFHMNGKPGEVVVDNPGVVLDFEIDFKRERVFFAHSSIVNPSDLHKKSLHNTNSTQRTRINAWVSQRHLGQIRELHCLTNNGPELEGWVLLPPSFSTRRKYPGILYIHGGPALAYGRVFMHEFQYLAGLGYVVFYCNPRGSHGYGAKFASAIQTAWGTVDYDDLMRFTDYVLDECPFIDPDKLGVTGGSYGGYMTNWIIGHTHRFKAAVTQRSVSNFLSWIGSSNGPFEIATWHTIKGHTPWQKESGLFEQSPLTHMVDVQTPTLIIHSEQDHLTHHEQAQQLYVQLKLIGVDTEYVRFPEEGHELSRSGRTDRRIERLKRISGWFDRYLRK